jgi:glyoxylase-like metal-dependent hydrolase (beta-lactamase superfamily II)
MNTVQTTPGIYTLWQRKGANVHAFLLDDGTGLTLIDTLFDNDAHRILDQLAALGKTVTDIKHIIMTHSHRSHLGGLALLKAHSGAPVYAHEWESDLIAGERAAQQVSWLPHAPYRTWYLQIANNLNLAHHPPATVDHFIHDGDRIGPVTVIFAAGHSPGHLAFWWPERRALFAGDAITTWPRFELGWRGFTLNPKQHQKSLRRLAELDSEFLGSGHGHPILAGAAAQVRAKLSTSS